MTPRPGFNPDKIAFYEKAGWEAYYDRKWLRVLSLMVQLNREQFGMSLPHAVAASVDIVRASIAFAPIDNNVPAALAFLRRYYDKARRSAGLQVEASTLANLEMDYWVVHRKLAIERKQSPNHNPSIEPLVDSLVRLHTGLFDAAPEAIRHSAELRALAAVAVDRITGHYSTDVTEDWRLVEDYLRQAYRTVESATP